MIDLSTIRILWRQPDTMTLWGVPYLMREGQQPGDIWRARQARGWARPADYGSAQVSLADWIYLGEPGWWGHMSTEDQDAAEAWLVGREVPGNPCEWCVVDVLELPTAVTTL
jgi:hypothetical protein